MGKHARRNRTLALHCHGFTVRHPPINGQVIRRVNPHHELELIVRPVTLAEDNVLPGLLRINPCFDGERTSVELGHALNGHMVIDAIKPQHPLRLIGFRQCPQRPIQVGVGPLQPLRQLHKAVDAIQLHTAKVAEFLRGISVIGVEGGDRQIPQPIVHIVDKEQMRQPCIHLMAV